MILVIVASSRRRRVALLLLFVEGFVENRFVQRRKVAKS